MGKHLFKTIGSGSSRICCRRGKRGRGGGIEKQNKKLEKETGEEKVDLRGKTDGGRLNYGRGRKRAKHPFLWQRE